MHYEEKLLGGKWHYRVTPNGDWLLMGAMKLTLKIESLTKELDDARNQNLNARAVDLFRLVQGLIDVGSIKISHAYQGQCPDSVDGPDLRDEECEACRILTSAESFLTNAGFKIQTNEQSD